MDSRWDDRPDGVGSNGKTTYIVHVPDRDFEPWHVGPFATREEAQAFVDLIPDGAMLWPLSPPAWHDLVDACAECDGRGGTVCPDCGHASWIEETS
jgi:hypothetical protein